ncbi:MAG TPA: hypothetical protein VFF76_10910 [Holophagaceae bacterium]|jgi:hypothetical protein|nr:hypothetical protein [Holophagaceae bacterium]
MSEQSGLSKRTKVALITLGLLLAAGIGARLAFGGAPDADDAPAKPPEATLDKGADGKPAIRLAKDQAEALDLKTAAATETTAADTLAIHGVVLDPFVFLDLDTKRRAASAAAQAAQAADAAAQAELSRVTALHGADHGASDKAMQEAQRAAADARAQRATTEGEARKAQAAWTQTGLDSVEGLGDFRRVIVRLDLPMGTSAPSPMPRTLAATSQGIEGTITLRVLGLAPGGSPLTGGLALLAVAPGKGLRPGLPVDAVLNGAKQTRVLVPRAAVVWSGGQAQVFVESGDGLFQPREVEVAFATGDDVVLAGGLKKNEQVVSQGALAMQGEYARLAEGAAIGAGGV